MSTTTRVAAVNGVELVVHEAGTGTPVVLAHGFPESAYSWRYTLPALEAAGYHAIAPDQRGYAGSSVPRDVSAYGIDDLTGDLLALLDETGHEQAVFVGHDWGALIVWDLARLHPERCRAVVGVSVPFTVWPAPPTQIFKQTFGDQFFYILYFQEVGPVERELEADTRRSMAKFLWSASGDARRAGERPVSRPMAGTGLWDTMNDPPAQLPAWLTAADIDHYAAEYAQSGFFGPVSYYRNLDANYERLRAFPASRASMPTFFIAGALDPVLGMGSNAMDRMREQLPDYRGEVLIPEVGHWTQQEAPEAFNDALLGFLKTL
jgi:pimeloyl-ACP methyl ester carboxylesterase